MGDAQASADEANMNYDMQSFYMEFLNKIRDDQLRYDGNHANDKGALADVVPFDGIGGAYFTQRVCFFGPLSCGQQLMNSFWIEQETLAAQCGRWHTSC